MLANLKALRTAQGLSQSALADFVKVSQQSIHQYENRDTEPDIAFKFASLVRNNLLLFDVNVYKRQSSGRKSVFV